MKKTVMVLLLLSVACIQVTAVQAANPVVKYFTRLLDETRAEMAIGELMQAQIIKEMPENLSIASDTILSERLRKLAESSARPDMSYNVIILQSDILDEIPLPGGTIILTSGLLAAAINQEQRDFILARNLIHIVLKHPMKLIKNEGLYPKLLNQLKLVPEKRNPQLLRTLMRDYLINLPKMDHKKADLQGILLTRSPEQTRKAAIEMLSSLAVRVWPVFPWDTGELPARISELEKLKLPE